MLISHADICVLQISLDRYLIFRLQNVERLYLSFDCYVCSWNLFRVVWVLSSLKSIYRNISMTQFRTMSKSTSFFDTFLVDVFLENEKEETYAVDLKLSIAQRLLFDYFKFDNWLVVEVKSIKSRESNQDESVNIEKFIWVSTNDFVTDDWVIANVSSIWSSNLLNKIAVIAFSKVALKSVLKDVSALLIDACALTLTLVEFYDISISMLIISRISFARLRKAISLFAVNSKYSSCNDTQH